MYAQHKSKHNIINPEHKPREHLKSGDKECGCKPKPGLQSKSIYVYVHEGKRAYDTMAVIVSSTRSDT